MFINQKLYFVSSFENFKGCNNHYYHFLNIIIKECFSTTFLILVFQ